MCTITFFWNVWADLPLVVAANRDEFYDRPSIGPQVFEVVPGLKALAGRDGRHGGSWMGVNGGGLFVGLTNRRGGEHLGGSRGEVVLRVLGCRTTEEAVAYLRDEVEGGDFRFFNLMFGTVSDVRVATLQDQGRLEMTKVSPGLHILPSGLADLDDVRWPKVRRAKGLLAPLLADSEKLGVQERLRGMWPTLVSVLGDDVVPSCEGLPEVCGRSGRESLFEAALQGIFVKTPIYGTRSSTIAAFDASGRVACYAFTERPPTEQNAWQHLASLLG